MCVWGGGYGAPPEKGRLGLVGTGPHTGGGCRPLCLSLHSTGPESWLNHATSRLTDMPPTAHDRLGTGAALLCTRLEVVRTP